MRSNLGPRLISRSPKEVKQAHVRVEIKEPTMVDAYLLLDGTRQQEVTLTDHGPTFAHFGIHENAPWYEVSFPGDEGKIEEDVPDKVFEILQRLTHLVKETMERKSDVILDITDDLKDTGCDLYTGILSDRDIELCARRFRKSR